MDNEINSLSDREIEVLRLVGQGKSNKEIAVALNISINTVKVHIGNIFQKTNVASRTEATLFAIEHGIIKSPASQNDAEEPESSIAVAEHAETVPENVFSRYRWAFLALGLILLVGLYFIVAKPEFLKPKNSSVDLPQQKWESLVSLDSPRSNMAVTTFEEKIIIIGGHSDSGVLDAVEAYDPATNTWTALKRKPTAVYDASAAVIGEKIYVPGGTTSSGLPTAIVEMFNPRKNSWEKCADLPLAISRYGLASYEGQLYLFGGWDSTKPLDIVLRYDPIADAWYQGSPMPTARFHAAAIATGGEIFVMGGSDGKGNLNANESYSPYKQLENEEPWLINPDLPEKLSGYSAVKMYDKISILGGKSAVSGAIDQFHYSPILKDWQIVNINSEATNAISEEAYTLLGEFIYMVGGKTDQGYLDSVLRYQGLYTILLPLTIN